jgi:hypothetical protein
MWCVRAGSRAGTERVLSAASEATNALWSAQVEATEDEHWSDRV